MNFNAKQLYKLKSLRNNVRPNSKECQALKKSFGTYFNKLSLREWFECVPKDFLYSSDGDNFEDQVSRAKVIVDEIIQTSCNVDHHVVKTFDGHGRFFYALLSVYFEALDCGKIVKNHQLGFVFYDFEESVDLWHQLFFPTCCVTCKRGNVFEDVDELFDGHNNSLVYLNFCGLGPNDLVGLISNLKNEQYSFNWLRNFSQEDLLAWMFQKSPLSPFQLLKQADVSEEEFVNSMLNFIEKYVEDDDREQYLRSFKKGSLTQKFKKFLNILPNEFLPNQINLINLIDQVFHFESDFFMVSFDVNGIIRMGGKIRQYSSITNRIWRALDEQFGELVSKRTMFVTYVVKDIGLYNWKNTKKDIYARDVILKTKSSGCPENQYVSAKTLKEKLVKEQKVTQKKRARDDEEGDICDINLTPTLKFKKKSQILNKKIKIQDAESVVCTGYMTRLKNPVIETEKDFVKRLATNGKLIK